MKNRVLVYISLAMSIAALVYAAWVHRQAKSMAEAALMQREKRLVEMLAPRVRQVYDGMRVTNRIDHPTTLEGLFGPYLDTLNRMVGGTETNR